MRAACRRAAAPPSLASRGQETLETEQPLPPLRPPFFPRACHTLLLFFQHLSVEHCRESVRGADSPSRGRAVTPSAGAAGRGWGGAGEDGDAGKRTPTFRLCALGGYSSPTSSSPPPPPPLSAPRRSRSQQRGWGRQQRRQWGLQPALEPGAGARAGGSGQLRGVEPQRQETEGISQDCDSRA